MSAHPLAHRAKLLPSLVAALFVMGCAGLPIASIAPKPAKSVLPGTTPGDVTDLKASQIANLPVEDLGGVHFKAITQDNAHLVGDTMAAGSSGVASRASAVTEDAAGAVAAAAPAAAPAAIAPNGGMAKGIATGGSNVASSTAGGAYSGNSDSYYGYGYWFGGSDDMSLVSMTEGETHGVASFKDLAAIMAPIVKDWDPTARVQTTTADLAGDGSLYNPTPDPTVSQGPQPPLCGATTPEDDFWTGNAWRVTYRSAKRNEVLQISGRADKTVIVRLRWAPLDLDLSEVQVDTGTAIAKVAAAIKDKSAEAEEEKTKLDYFLGVPFNQRTGMEWQDPRYTKFSVLYEVPPGAHWNATLDRVLGKLVWDLSFNAYDGKRDDTERQQAIDAFHAQGYAAFGLKDPRTSGPAPSPSPATCLPYAGYPFFRGVDGGFFLGSPQAEYTPVPSAGPGFELVQNDPYVYLDLSSNAMVDAKTGTLIRFSRPTKTITIPAPFLRPLPSTGPTMPPPPDNVIKPL